MRAASWLLSRDNLVFPYNKPRLHLDVGHCTAEPTIHLRELKSDVASAETKCSGEKSTSIIELFVRYLTPSRPGNGGTDARPGGKSRRVTKRDGGPVFSSVREH
jgi:hypothetical protein